MAIVVTPKTEAECNQIRSVLHSHNRKLWCTSKVDSAITVGKVVICWGGTDTDYTVRSAQDEIVATLYPENVPVNALYQRLYHW